MHVSEFRNAYGARVAPRNLHVNGFFFHFILVAAFPDLARYGQGDGPIHLTAVDCSGSETKITQCLHSMSTSSNHQNDVGVKCGEG